MPLSGVLLLDSVGDKVVGRLTLTVAEPESMAVELATVWLGVVVGDPPQALRIINKQGIMEWRRRVGNMRVVL